MMAIEQFTLRVNAKFVIAPVMLLLLVSLPMSVLARSVPETVILPVEAGKDILLTTFPIAPDFKFTHLSLEDGLSQTTVISIFQDSRGFMWFGTQDGLNRYDGYNFVVYRNDPNELNSLGDNRIRAIVEDPLGNLWIGTEAGGLNKYDPSTDTFTRYRHDPGNANSLKNNRVWSIWQNEAGFLWLYMDEGWLTQFEPKSETFTHYQFAPPELTNPATGQNIKAIYQDRSGIIWLSNDEDGLVSFNPETGRFTYFLHDPADATTISPGEVLNVYEDNADNLWISKGGGLDLLDRESGQFTYFQYDPDDPYSISDSTSRQVYQDRTGTYWVATAKGLNLFDPRTGQFIRYQVDPTNPYALSDDNIDTIYEDRGGVLWIGTNGGGVNKLDLGRVQFTHYRNLPDNPNSLSTSYVYSIYEDKDDILWVGGDDGTLNRFDRANNQVTRYEPDAENPYALNESWSVSAIYEDSTGAFWVGTYDGGLHRFDRKTRQFQRYLHNPDEAHSIASDIILAIYEDSTGTLWIGTDGGGLNRFDRQTGEFHHYLSDPGNSNNLRPGTIRGIYEDHFGFLWLTSWIEGLTRFDPKAEQFVNYRHDPDHPQSLGRGEVYVVHEDHEGTLWVGTSSGLDKFDRLTETFRRYTEEDGLPNSVIYAVMEDATGNLWVSTNKGLSKFDPRTETFQNYNVFDGLQSDEFNQNAFFQSNSGEMFFGGIKGLNAFYPEQITNNPYRPPVILTDFQLFNQSVAIGKDSILQRAIWNTEHITLNYDQDVFSIAFAALSYAAPEENRYRYKLEGFDDEWNEVDAKRRFATYTSLPPGDYIFRVQAANEDGVWNEEGVSLFITIKSPWWGTWWFRGFAFITLVALFFSGYRLRVRNIERYNQELKHQVEERTAQLEDANKVLEAFAYSVSHDLRAPLRHVDGFIDMLQKRTKTTLDDKSQHYMEVIADSAKQMGTLIDDLLSFSRMGRTEMSKSQVDLGELIEDVVRELRPEAEGRDVQWKISPLPLVTGDRAMLRMVLVNLISNALKFTRSRKIAQIEIGCEEKNETETVIFVRDNGVGFDMNYFDKLFGVFQRLHRQEDFEGTGIGLANVRRIINRHGGRAWADGQIDHGATFYFSLPNSK
jgi:signal transduction histidine kinase/ligand-binding sensor domain-containing protein